MNWLIVAGILGYAACAFGARGYIRTSIEHKSMYESEKLECVFFGSVLWPIVLFYILVGSHVEWFGQTIATRKLLNSTKRVAKQLQAKKELEEVEREIAEITNTL